MQPMYYIGLDVHKRTISYCVKDGSGAMHAEDRGTRSLIYLQAGSARVFWQTHRDSLS
jgi:hypothetical protein